MSDRFITYVIIGVAFGFTQLWFAYWVVKLYKEKQRILKARRALMAVGRPAARSGSDDASPPEPPSDPGAATVATPPSAS